jgi:predicted transcriptional regulator
LNLPIEEFINEIRREDLVDRAPTINILPETDLGSAIKKFVAIKRHRMFIRQGHDLVGIITVSDVLKAFATAQE